MNQHFFIEDTVERRAVHRPRQRTEATVAEPVEGRKVGVAERNLGEAGRLFAEISQLVRGNLAIHGFTYAAVRRNEVGHFLLHTGKTLLRSVAKRQIW